MAGRQGGSTASNGARGDYWQEKKRKLQEQQAEATTSGVQRSSIFARVAIHVNGFTTPGASLLRQHMMHNGGVYHDYYRPNETTHIVASNLTLAKANQLKQGDKVVRPQWITDSLAAGRLLPDIDYLLCGKRQGCGAMEQFVRPTDKAGAGPAAKAATANKGGAASSSNDPDFVANFYARSRLHFISTWAQKMKQFVAEIKDSAASVQLTGIARLTRHMSYTDGSAESAARWDAASGSTYMHIDMDCFFVSVSLLGRPELRGQPVAVTHASQQHGQRQSMAEIASCSYEARAAGVSNGMLVGSARERCTGLVVVPYEFDQYDRISKMLYHIVTSYTLDVEAVSCDELYAKLDGICSATGSTPTQVATCMREHIRDETGCPASAGIGGNMLVARLATRRAKPDGMYFVHGDHVQEFMSQQRASHLPGIGHSTLEKLNQLHLVDSAVGRPLMCTDVQSLPLSALTSSLGAKTGRSLFDACRGKCERTLGAAAVRKTVSCDINFGIRMSTIADADAFLGRLSEEVSSRLAAINMFGRTVTLRLLIRAPNAPLEPAKYMGCGECVAWSRSATVPQATADAALIGSEVRALWRAGNPVVADVRGIGIGMSRLVSCQGEQPAAKCLDEYFKVGAVSTESAVQSTSTSSTSVQRRHGCMPLEANDIDADVLAALPDDIRSEVLARYGGEPAAVAPTRASSTSTGSGRQLARSSSTQWRRRTTPRGKGARSTAARSNSAQRPAAGRPRDKQRRAACKRDLFSRRTPTHSADLTLTHFFSHAKRWQRPSSSLKAKSHKSPERPQRTPSDTNAHGMHQFYDYLDTLLLADDEAALCAITQLMTSGNHLRGRLHSIALHFRKLHRQVAMSADAETRRRYNSLRDVFQACVLAHIGATLANVPRFHC